MRLTSQLSPVDSPAIPPTSRCCAGIVTYNPDPASLAECIRAVLPQVELVIVVDNCSTSSEELFDAIDEFPGLYMVYNQENRGLAAALNQVVAIAEDRGFNWVLTLDQDSVVPASFVSTLMNAIPSGLKTGIVAPIIVDRQVGVIGHTPRQVQRVRTCITSGSLTSVSAWRDVGGFDEYLFIDSVDFEYCYRLKRAGYAVLQSSSTWLSHRIGDSELRRFFGFKVRVPNHSAFRKFYIVRNGIYFPRKYGLTLRQIRGILRAFRLLIVVLLYEQDKMEKVKAIVRGLRAGFAS